jgi:hypothetical protein
MAEPGVPPPRGFISLCREADVLLYLQLQDVEVVGSARHSSEHSLVLIADLQEPILDVDSTATLLELPKANNISLELWDEVDIGEPPVLTAFVDEEYGATPLDLDDGSIPKLDRATNPKVKLRECGPRPDHVVGSPCIKDPPSVILMLSIVVDRGEYILLLQVHPVLVRDLTDPQPEVLSGRC